MVRNSSNDSDADHSSSDESGYSDEIDDDIVAELYSSVHYESRASLPETSQDDDLGGTSSHEISQNDDLLNVNSNSNGVCHLKSHEQSSCIVEKKDSNEVIPNHIGSDFAVEGNLYTSFETPPGRNMVNMQSSDQGKDSANSKINRKRKSDLAVSNGSKKTKIEESLPPENRHKTDEEPHTDGEQSCIILSEDSDLQTDEELLVISSDDGSISSEDESERHFSRIENSSFLTLPSSSSKDPWHINDDDLYRRKKRTSSRYHEKAAITCSNCKQKGHSANFCSVRKVLKCLICGGDHPFNSCRNKICYRCFDTGHDERYCSQRFHDSCGLCNMSGHRVMECPDLWRRYHLTTSGSKVIKGKKLAQNSPLYCFNCGALGHYGLLCSAPRLGRPTALPRWTSVISYLPTIVSIRKILGNISKMKRNSVPWEQQPMKKGKKNEAFQTPPFNGIERNQKWDKNSWDFPRTPKQYNTCQPSTSIQNNTEQPVKMRKKSRAKVSKSARKRLSLQALQRKEAHSFKLRLSLGVPPRSHTPI